MTPRQIDGFAAAVRLINASPHRGGRGGSCNRAGATAAPLAGAQGGAAVPWHALLLSADPCSGPGGLRPDRAGLPAGGARGQC
eukprot:11196213-Lingulodinium_polyedra.AAC.1